MTKSLSVRELLKIDSSFNPLDIDTKEVRELSSLIPKDGHIDTNKAESLATKFLRGSDICGELLSMGITYLGKTESDKKRAYSHAALINSTVAGHKTDKARAWFAEMDETYIEACNRYNEALAFTKWAEQKHKSFEKMHYLCKMIMQRGYATEKTAGWTGSVEEPEVPLTDESNTW